jgi:hypothetical protein
MVPCTLARRDTRTRSPLEKIWIWQGLTDRLSGATLLPLSNLMRPSTRMTDGARTTSCALRRSVTSPQIVYVPPSRTSEPGPAPPPATSIREYVPPAFSTEPSCPTMIASLDEHGEGRFVGKPQALARLPTTGCDTGVRGPHFDVAAPEFASSALQTVALSRSTELATRREAGASMRLVPSSDPFVPTSPDSTTSPRAFSLSSAKSTKSPSDGVWASAARATSVATRTGKAARDASRVMGSPSGKSARTASCACAQHFS